MSDPRYEHVGSRTTHLIEECSELIKTLCKVERFGWDSYHPDDPEKVPNYRKVLREMSDVDKRMDEVKDEIYQIIYGDDNS